MMPWDNEQGGNRELISVEIEDSFSNDMKICMRDIADGAKMDDMDKMMDGMMSFYYMMKIHEGKEAKRELKEGVSKPNIADLLRNI